MKKVILTFIIGVFAVVAANAQTRKSEQARAWKQFQDEFALERLMPLVCGELH